MLITEFRFIMCFFKINLRPLLPPQNIESFREEINNLTETRHRELSYLNEQYFLKRNLLLTNTRRGVSTPGWFRVNRSTRNILRTIKDISGMTAEIASRSIDIFFVTGALFDSKRKILKWWTLLH